MHSDLLRCHPNRQDEGARAARLVMTLDLMPSYRVSQVPQQPVEDFHSTKRRLGLRCHLTIPSQFRMLARSAVYTVEIGEVIQ